MYMLCIVDHSEPIVISSASVYSTEGGITSSVLIYSSLSVSYTPTDDGPSISTG